MRKKLIKIQQHQFVCHKYDMVVMTNVPFSHTIGIPRRYINPSCRTKSFFNSDSQHLYPFWGCKLYVCFVHLPTIVTHLFHWGKGGVSADLFTTRLFNEGRGGEILWWYKFVAIRWTEKVDPGFFNINFKEWRAVGEVGSR